MGEYEQGRIRRTIGVAIAVGGAVAMLTSCSQLGMTPASQPTDTGAVIDPSVPSATPSDVAAPTASATPTESVTAVPATTAPTATRTAVVPFITTAEWDAKAQTLDVSAIVPSLPESGGTCTVTVTQGSTTRTAMSTGVAASTYTGCQAVALSGLAAGTWQVRVHYSSTKAAGDSAVRTVQVG